MLLLLLLLRPASGCSAYRQHRKEQRGREREREINQRGSDMHAAVTEERI